MRLAGVGRRYGVRGPWVLRDVDLDVPTGAVLRIEGANGTGKSTLLRLLAGIDAPTAGRVTGRPTTAYVPERFPVALPFDAAGYLTHLGRVHGLPDPVAGRRAHAWLERFGIAGYARTPMERLSKGTAQKVAVAQALLAEPRLLVLDEAWTGLDTTARGLLDEAVGERAASGGTVVFVDHDPRRLADATTAVHRVEGTALVPVPTRPSAGTARVLIDATGDGEPPPALPPSAAVLLHEGGALRITVPAGESDAALRALLAARPPWHIRGVRAAEAGRAGEPGRPGESDRPGEPDRSGEPGTGES